MARNWRTVRVYISSNFREMQAERDYLTRMVFPELQERCSERRLHLQEVDLRWGITEEDVAEGRVTQIVQDEVDRADLMILLLGQRYGWIPPDLTTSFNEMEIMRFIGHSWGLENTLVGVRDPDDTQQIHYDSEERPNYVDDSAENTARLVHFKKRLEESGVRTFVYRCRWDNTQGRFIDFEELGIAILEFLWDRISRTYPEGGSALAAQQDEQYLQESFVESRQRFYVGREIDQQLMMDYVAEGDSALPVVLTGPPGSGKSSILAALVTRAAVTIPELLIVSHFIEAGPTSSNLRSMLWRLCHELVRIFNFAEDVPENAAELKRMFRSLLQRIPAHQKVLLVIDGLNHLDLLQRAHELRWLPAKFSSNIRAVFSTSAEGGILRALLSLDRPHQEWEVKPLSHEACKVIIGTVLASYGKKLDQQQIYYLSNNPAISNPLFLWVALQELRTFGKFEEVTKRIHDFPHGEDSLTIVELFIQVIHRLEADYGTQLVRTFLCSLSASRFGLDAQELSDLSGSGIQDIRRILRDLRPHLLERANVFSFAHRTLREAIGLLYTDTSKERQSWHIRLADYFETQRSSAHSIYELPWQRIEGRDWAGLKRALCNLAFIETKCKMGGLSDLCGDFELALATAESSSQDTDKIEAFGTFVTQHIPVLRNADVLNETDLISTLAFNSARNGPVAELAHSLLSTRRGSLPQISTQRPIFSPTVRKHAEQLNMGPVVGVSLQGQSDSGFSAGTDGTVFFWDLTTLEKEPLFSVSNGIERCSFANGIAWILNGKAGLEAWSIETGEFLRSFSVPGKALAVSPAAEGRSCFVSNTDGALYLFSLSQGQWLEALFCNLESPAAAIAIDPSSLWISCGQVDGVISLWNVKTKSMINCFTAHKGPVVSVTWADSGETLLTTGNDWSITVWRFPSCQKQIVLLGHSSRITGIVSLDFDESKMVLSAGGWDQTLFLWDLGDPIKPRYSLRSVTPKLTSVAILPKRMLAVSGGVDGTVEFWELSNLFKPALTH